MIVYSVYNAYYSILSVNIIFQFNLRVSINKKNYFKILFNGKRSKSVCSNIHSRKYVLISFCFTWANFPRYKWDASTKKRQKRRGNMHDNLHASLGKKSIVTFFSPADRVIDYNQSCLYLCNRFCHAFLALNTFAELRISCSQSLQN